MTQWVFAEKEWACMREGDLLWRGGGWFGEDNDKAEEGLKNNAAVVGTVLHLRQKEIQPGTAKGQGSETELNQLSQ